MKVLSRIMFPLTVMAAATAGVVDIGQPPVRTRSMVIQKEGAAPDTVIYVHDGYKLKRTGNFTEENPDSLLMFEDAVDTLNAKDTIPVLTARDTIKVPDSLRLTDPFRYKYYVALFDSLTRRIVCDSLKAEYDSLRRLPDSVRTASDSLLAIRDSIDWKRVDSIYVSDSTALAKAAFTTKYLSWSTKKRREYDTEQMVPLKLAEMDSLKEFNDKHQSLKDSLIENTPRILESYSIPDSMAFKRIVTWTEDRDFGGIKGLSTPDTTFNYRFYDHRWQREDVNASWLGVPGSPVQKYDFFQRTSREGVTFNDALEAWSYDPGNLPHFNTKTPYTELCYYGTILASNSKESDNLHLFTTQNITPAFNFQLLYDRYGGGGFMENEETKNNNAIVATNYLGRKYQMHAGFIHNVLSMGENGGAQDPTWIRDTLLEDSRDVPVMLKSASSKTSKNTIFLDQQFRIPFNFINKIKARKDSTFTYDADSLDRNLTTAFIGHSSELSFYDRTYGDKIEMSDAAARYFYNNVFNYNQTASADTQKVTKLDNKVYMRLQPWASDAPLSKLDVGLGDRFLQYRDSTTARPLKHTENSIYFYAGVGGQFKQAVTWSAKGSYTIAGSNFGDFSIEADAGLALHPFRRAKNSPLNVGAHFESTLTEPSFYQKCMNANHFKWANDFSKISSTKIQGHLDIPYWRLSAQVGYALLANTVYYDSLGIARQHNGAMSVLSASVRKDLVFGPVHLENRALLQLSSDQNVVPVPLLALNARWYAQFVVQNDPITARPILQMQAGVNVWYNTAWHSPAWNPNIGVFYNQNTNLYNNGPVFDVFVNMQWKRAVIFIKYQNAGRGWPMRKRDYFSADRYALNTPGIDALKLGIYWPFYTQPAKHHSSSEGGKSSPANGGAKASRR